MPFLAPLASEVCALELSSVHHDCTLTFPPSREDAHLKSQTWEKKMWCTNTQPAASTVPFPRANPADEVTDLKALHTPELGLCQSSRKFVPN